MKKEAKKSKGFLGVVEKVGNKLPNPATLFIYLSIITMILSLILSNMNVSVIYDAIDAKTNEIVQKSVSVINLLSKESIQEFTNNVLTNFTNFFPLRTVFTIILGVGVAEGTGLLGVLIKKIAVSTSKKWITPIVVFLGVMSNVASSTGYVVLVPLGAILFLGFGRHPIAGLAAAFAGVSGGWSANLLIGSNDPMFAGMSTQAAQQIDPNYLVQPTANWYFMIVSTFLITLIGWYVTDKIVEPRLGAYNPDTDMEDPNSRKDLQEVTDLEKRGLKFALIATIVYVGLILLTVVPENSLFGPASGESFMHSTFMKSIIVFMMLLFLIPGVAYGIGAKSIKNDSDVIELMNKAIAGLSSFMVLIFFAAQFTYLFNASNLGTVMSVAGADLLKNIGLVGLPLLILFIILTAFINIFIAVDSAKWAMMAPIFVPMFMNLHISPELTQLAYRIGDSSTNIIAPLMPFFVLIVAFMQKYDKKMKIGSLISIMLPYSLGFLVFWIILMVVWYILKLPIGPNVDLNYMVSLIQGGGMFI